MNNLYRNLGEKTMFSLTYAYQNVVYKMMVDLSSSLYVWNVTYQSGSWPKVVTLFAINFSSILDVFSENDIL